MQMTGVKSAGTVQKIFLTIVAAVLAAMLLWFIALPEQDYEPVPNTVENVTASEYISSSGIYQTLTSNGRLKGIRVRWYTKKTVPTDDVIVDLMDPVNRCFLERVVVPASEIIHNAETDILFAVSYDPGQYLVMLTCLPDSTSTIAVWECGTDSYKEGEAFNSRGEREGRDWSFRILTEYPASLLIRHRIQRIVAFILVPLAAAGVLCWIWWSEQLRKRRRIADAVGFVRKYSDHILIALLILIPVVSYLDFLTGERLYIFSMLDRGADSAGQTYPGLLHTAARIAQGLWGEQFNFYQGLGDPESAFFPTLTSWVALFGESAVARLMGISQCLKVILSGIFAWLFAKEYGAGRAARFLIALGFAFNSMLIARGAWESYPNIAMLVMLWLYAFERKLNGKGVLLFLFATLFMFVNFVLYDCLFYGVLLPGYMLARRIMKEKTVSRIFRVFLRDLAPFAVFALLGMMDTVRYSLARTLSSGRLQTGMAEYAETGGGSFFSAAEIWISAFLRTAGHSISGITWQTGSLNLLEGPAFYVGIAVLLIAPAAVWCMKGKQKAVFLLLIACALIYIAVVPLRLIANGFSKETFKLSSSWIMLLLMLLAAEFFRRTEGGELRKGTGVVLAISAGAVVALLIVAKATGYVASDNEWIVSMVFAVLYLILTGFLVKGTGTPLVKGLLVLCAVAEAFLVPYEMINERCTENAVENSWNYHAEVKEVVASLPDDEWYRIEKDYATVFQSDSLAEGFRGSASYVGGIEINQSVLDIYQTFSLPQRNNHYLYGSGGNIYFESISSTRYLLSANDLEFRYGYEFVKEQNGIKVYKNRYCHPFVYVSQEPGSAEYLTEEPEQNRRVAYERNGILFVFNSLPENSVLVIEAEMDAETRCTLYMEDRNRRFSSVYFMGGSHARIEIANPEVYALWFDSTARNHMKEITFYAVDQDTYYSVYREESVRAQQNAVQMEAVNDNYFRGTVKTEENGYIVTAIPYDQKWKICLDQKIQDTIVVNGGFLGAALPEGEYLLEIRYEGESWIIGNAFKLIGFGGFILAAVVILWHRNNRKRGNHSEH